MTSAPSIKPYNTDMDKIFKIYIVYILYIVCPEIFKIFYNFLLISPVCSIAT